MLFPAAALYFTMQVAVNYEIGSCSVRVSYLFCFVIQ